eukprot:927978-Pleurochrysis_carterae.AAC.1
MACACVGFNVTAARVEVRAWRCARACPGPRPRLLSRDGVDRLLELPSAAALARTRLHLVEQRLDRLVDPCVDFAPKR